MSSRDDEVVLPSLTFIAPANAVRYLGAWPVFVDVDDETGSWIRSSWPISSRTTVSGPTGAEQSNTQDGACAAFFPVDILGHPADLDAIVEIARRA